MLPSTMTLLRHRDFIAGLVFAGLGLAFAFGATHYAFGSSARPGPGLIPFALGLMLAGLGAFLAGDVLLKPGAARAGDSALPIAWRPFLVVMAAIALFGLLLERAGLLLTLPAVIATVSLAAAEVRWREVALSAVVLTAGCWLLFIQGLGLLLPVWPNF
jgi:Tripartite tricarboxylate transporter TctB family